MCSVLPDDSFPTAFAELIKEAYSDLFELRGDDAWKLTKTQLTGYFRTTDKTSEVIGSRQAGVFQVFRMLSGYEAPDDKSQAKPASKPRKPQVKKAGASVPKAAAKVERTGSGISVKDKQTDMALTVRIEINLPPNGSRETYDNIFKSIRANLYV